MNLRLLYPSDPLNSKIVDETYSAEFDAAVRKGLQSSVLSLEDFEQGSFRVRPALAPSEAVIYRGWMLTPKEYQDLHSAILAKGAAPLTSVHDYQRCHYLPGWYEDLKEFTAETVVLSEDANFVDASPFFSVDTAALSDGTLRIVELGDGQVSDRKEWSPDQFLQMFV